MVLERPGEIWRPPISFIGDLFSSPRRQTQTIQVQAPAPSATQMEAERIALEANRMSLDQMRRAEQERLAYEASPLKAIQDANQLKANQLLQAKLTGTAPILSPEEEANLNTIYGTAQARGEEDLLRYAQEIAGARGMTTADSPIGNEALRQRRLFGESLNAQKLSSMFDLGNAQTAFAQQQQAFGDQLKQQAFLNRMAMASLNPAAAQFASNLGNTNASLASRTVSGNLFAPQTAALLQGTGNLFAGIGQFGRGVFGGGLGGGTPGSGLSSSDLWWLNNPGSTRIG